MTSQETNGLKRSLSPTEEDCEVNKKSRANDVSFEYTLKLVMDPSMEPEFVKWLQPTIEAEAGNRGGSCALIPAQFED